MAAEVSADLNLIQDEDVLRRMWTDTEDFGRKKEIRARMYKLREQRLRDFYTTGEVVTEIAGRKHTSTTHTESIGDQGFLTMKTKEIRDSESPTRDFSRRGENNYWSSKKESAFTTGNNDGALVETRVQSNEGHGLITDGNTQTKIAMGAQNVHETSSKSDDNMSCKSESLSHSSQLVSASKTEDDTGSSFSTTARQEQNSQSKSEQKSSTSQSSTTKWSSSTSSSKRIVSSTSQSYQITSDGEKKLIDMKAITTGDDNISNMQGSQIKESATNDNQILRDSRLGSDNVRDVRQGNDVVREVQQGNHIVHDVITQGSEIKEMRQGSEIKETRQGSEVREIRKGTNLRDVRYVTDDRDVRSDDRDVKRTTEVREVRQGTDIPDISPGTDIRDLRQDRDSFRDSQDNSDVVRKVTHGSDETQFVSNMVSSKSNENQHFTTVQETRTIVNDRDHRTQNNKFIQNEKLDTNLIQIENRFPQNERQRDVPETDDAATCVRTIDRDDRQTKTKISSDVQRTEVDSSNVVTDQKIMNEIQKLDSYLSTQNTPGASTPVSPHSVADSANWTIVSNTDGEFVYQVDKTTDNKLPPTDGRREPIKHPSTLELPREKTEGQYTTTYQQSYKRISVDNSPTHEFFARTLRASPDRSTPSPTKRASSKGSLDRGTPSPTKRTSSKGSLDRSSPERKLRGSPSRKTPEKERRVSVGSYTIEKPQETRRKTSEGTRYTSTTKDTTKTKRKFSSTQAKTANKARVATPGASPSTSPTRTARPRRSSSSGTESDSSQVTYDKKTVSQKSTPTSPIKDSPQERPKTSTTDINVTKTSVIDTTIDKKTDDKYGTYDRKKKVQDFIRMETEANNIDVILTDSVPTGSRLIQPSPREGSPGYSSEGSVSRELKDLKSPVKHFHDTRPETSVFEPIKTVQKTSEKEHSTAMIFEEQQHTTEIRTSDDLINIKDQSDSFSSRETPDRLSASSPRKEPRSSSISPCSSPDRATKHKSSITPDTSPERVSKTISPKARTEKLHSPKNKPEDKEKTPQRKSTPTSTMERSSPQRKQSRPSPSSSPERTLDRKPTSSQNKDHRVLRDLPSNDNKKVPEQTNQKKKSIPSQERKSPEKTILNKKSYPSPSPERAVRPQPTASPERIPEKKSSLNESPDRVTRTTKSPSSSPERNLTQERRRKPSPAYSPERPQKKTAPTPSPERTPKKESYRPSHDRSPKPSTLSPERSPKRREPDETQIKQKRLPDTIRTTKFNATTSEKTFIKKTQDHLEPREINRVTKKSSIPRAENKPMPKKSKENIQPKPVSKLSSPITKRPNQSPQSRLISPQTRTDSPKATPKQIPQSTLSKPKQVPARKPTPAITMQKTSVISQIRKTDDSINRSKIPVDKKSLPSDQKPKAPAVPKKPQTSLLKKEVKKTIQTKDIVEELIDEEYPDEYEPEIVDITEIEERDITDNITQNIEETTVSLSDICQKNIINKSSFIEQEKYVIENLEDERPPDEFYADFDEETTIHTTRKKTDKIKEHKPAVKSPKQLPNDIHITKKQTQKTESTSTKTKPSSKPLAPKQVNTKPTSKFTPQQPKMKPTNVTKPSRPTTQSKPSTPTTKTIKTTVQTKDTRTDKMKQKPEHPKRIPGKKMPQARRDSSSSSSTEDEAETTITKEELKISRNNNQLYTEEVEVTIKTEEDTDRETKDSTEETHLKVVVQHPRSSRESSPDFPAKKGLPVSGTSDDGESIPRYADYVSEPEDVEIFDYSSLGPRKPIPCTENKPARITDLDEDSDSQIKLDVSVADRVSKFMETSRIQTDTTCQETSPVSTGSPASVRKAKALFENIAKSQAAPPTPSNKKIDIYDNIEPHRKASLPKEKPENLPKEEVLYEDEIDIDEEITTQSLEELEIQNVKKISVTERQDFIETTEISREPVPELEDSPRKPSIPSDSTQPKPDARRQTGPQTDSPQSKPKSKPNPEDATKKPFERKPSSVSGDISSKKAFFEGKAKDSSPKDKAPAPKKDTPKPKPIAQQPKQKTPTPEKQSPQKHESVDIREEVKSVRKEERRESVDRTTRIRTSTQEIHAESERTERPRSPIKQKPQRESPARERHLSSPSQSPERKSPRRSVERESPERSPLKTKDVNTLEMEELTQEQTKAGKFGVTLRRTPSSTSNKVTPTPRKPSIPMDGREIEDIFQLELLEEMLLRAVAYDERRRIRAQIRVAKRQIEEGIVTQKTTKTVVSTTSTSPKKPQEREPRKSVEKKDTTTASQKTHRRSVERTTEILETTRTTNRRDSQKNDSVSPERPKGTQRTIESVKTYRQSPERKSPERKVSSQHPKSPTPERHVSQTKRTIESVTVIRGTERKSPERRAPAKGRSPDREQTEKRTLESVRSVKKPDEDKKRPSPTKQASPERRTERTSTTTRTVESVKTFRSSDRSPERRKPERESPERRKPERESPERRKPERESPERRTIESVKNLRNRVPEPLTNGYDKPQLSSRESQSKITQEVTSTTVRSQRVKKTSNTEVKEPCPTDSITSSYGVGPTDENGRPLFGLKALRRTNTNKTLTDEDEHIQTEETVEVIETEEQEISDASGRPLFGLKALQTAEPAMPAQPSAQLKELVEKHQQFVLRESSTTEQPRQKPKARLRDSFLSQSQDEDIMTTSVTSSVDDGQTPRGLSLRSIIQKHEGASNTGSNVRSEVRSSSTVVKSQSTMSSDGKVSVKKDVIRGEMVAKNGEEPVGKITKSHYSYQSPEDKHATPTITSTTTTSHLGQRRRSSGAKILEVEDNDNSETVKNRRFSKEYIVDEVDDTSKTTSHKSTRRESNTETEKTATTDLRISQNLDDDWKKPGKIISTTVTTVTRKQSGPRVTELVDESDDSVFKTSSEKVVTRNVSKTSSGTTETQPDKPGKKTVIRGDSVRALQHKFQQATVSSTVKKSNATTERRDSKTKLQESRSRETKSASPVITTKVTTHQDSRTVSSVTKEPLDGGETITKVTKVSQSGTSFLDNNTKVTGVQDVLNRMRNANLVVESGDTAEDAEARALLNKFLGASVILQGMEQGMRSAQAAQPPSSAALVSQAEKQRVMSTTTRKQEDFDEISDEKQLRILLEACLDYEDRRKIRARLRTIMADQKAPGDDLTLTGSDASGSQRQEFKESKQVTTKSDGDSVSKTEVHTTRTTSSSARLTKANSVQSPFAKFRQLERQNSAPSVGRGAPMFKFTDPKLVRSASTIKERLLNWVQAQTREYKNIKIENFSTCWSNGLAFCALIHHFCPDAFDYDSLTPEKRRYNFELAFRIAEEKAGIYPLLDVEDMVTMRKPDWKCVFTYVQSIHRRFHDSSESVRF